MYNRILQGLTTERDAEEFEKILKENEHVRDVSAENRRLKFLILVALVFAAVTFLCLLTNMPIS